MQQLSERREKRALRAVAVQYLVNGVVAAAYIPRLPEIRENLQIDLATIGQLITLASIGGLLGSWLCSKLLTRFTTKQLMIVGSILLILILPGVAFASSVASLVIVLACIYFIDVVVDVAVNMQGSVLNARRHTPVMNRLHGIWSIGTVVGGTLASLMAAYAIPLHWHLTGVSLLLGLALLYVAKDLLSTDGRPEEPNISPSAAPLRRSRLLLFILLGAGAFVPEMILSDWAPFRLREDLGASEALSGVAYVAFGSGMVLGRMGGDWVVSKVGSVQLLNLATATALIGLLMACFIDTIPLCYLGFCIAGLGVSVLFPALYDTAARDRGRPGAALGAMTAGSRGAMLLAPLTIGSLANSPSLTVGMAIALVAPLCLLMVWWLSHKVTQA